MYVIAIIGDLLGFLFGWFPGAGFLIGGMTGMALFLAGSHEGVNIYSADHIGLTLPIFAAEMVPFVSMMPLWTMRVWVAKRVAKRDGEQ